MCSRRARGFTVIELLIASVVLLAVVLAVFSVLHAAPDAFAVDGDVADMHQRLRVAQASIFRDLVAAPAVRPYRTGGRAPDPPGAFRSDTITAIGRTVKTYWLKTDDRAGTYQLMSYAGGISNDVPVVDNVVALAFEYAG